MLLWIHHSVQAESMLTLRCPQPTVWHGGSHRSWPFYTLYIIHVSPDRQSLVRDFLSLLMRIIELHCGLGFSFLQFSSVQFSRSVMSDCLRPHESQHTRPPCPSPTPGVYSNSCPSSRWCHPAISSSIIPFLDVRFSLRSEGLSHGLSAPYFSLHRLVLVSVLKVKDSEGPSVVSNSLWPHELYSPWNSPGQNAGVGNCSLLQGTFPAQGLNPGLPHSSQTLYQLSNKGSPRIWE